MWWSDEREYTGEGRWERFRSLGLWKWITPVKASFPYKTDLTATAGRRIFLFIPCSTPATLIWSVGLHGGVIDFKHTIHYMIPAPYLWIPIMREILLWTGAVTYSAFNPKFSRQAVMLDLLNHGRSVCYSPSNFANSIHNDLESAIETRYPSDELLAFAIAEKIQIIPVVVQGEHERYRIVQSNWLRWLQTWMYEKIHYAFPLVYWYRLFSNKKPPPVTVQFEAIITSDIYNNAADLKATIKESVDRSIIPVLKDKQIKGV